MKKKLISFFKKYPGQSFRSKDVARKLDITSEHEYSSLKALLFKLFEEDFLSKSGKRYKLNTTPVSGRIVGTLEMNQGGYGFVIPENKKLADIFIAARNLGTAFSGDVVNVALFAKQKGKNTEGQIIEVIKRERDQYVGILKKSNSFYFIKPDDPKIHRDIYIDEENLNGAKVGDKVIVSELIWKTSMLNPEGSVIEVLGKSGTIDAEITSIAKEFKLPYKFSDKVLNDSEVIKFSIDENELKNRIDFRDKNVITIDPYDAKDFDDALSIETLESGNFSVGIHIADVSHYVQKKTKLDDEALYRGNSVYLVGRVIPMLPERLSNIICSLVPDEERLTYSVIAELTSRGKLISYQIKKTIIKSKRRFTYEEVQQIIDDKAGELYDEINQLNTLAQTLRKKRMREGSIEFSTAEIKFQLDENGYPVGVTKKEIKQSNMLVEEFMLLANKIVAEEIGKRTSAKARPFIYRIHDLPDKEKLFEFSKFVKSLGYSFDANSKSKSNQFQKLILEVKGTPEESLINELAIRSMAKAIYSINNIGHYGLGFSYYTHFTSPIRRYSDLMVHRLLYNYVEINQKAYYSLEELDEISDHISDCERRAIEAERLSVKLKQIEYLRNHLGEEFDAVISGITNFGMFVKIIDLLAEGLIRLRDLDDYYVYDEKKYSLVGKASKKVFRLGDKLKVKLVRVDTDKSELDFIIAE
ncbi:MAG: ribonuclease R [Ignavibacteriales bacterium]|nr:MAG: ribonuclease R [Ignavibacteriales bacterium]